MRYQDTLHLLREHDIFSYEHSIRVGFMYERIVDAFRIQVPREVAIAGAYLHDIGKMFVPERVLRKPSRLTAEEWEVMQSHTVLGARLLKELGYPKTVCDMAHLHHERRDGRGYFHRRDLLLHIVLLCICDSFTSMTEDRIYRKGMAPDTAWSILMKSRGQFPREIVQEVKAVWQSPEKQSLRMA